MKRNPDVIATDLDDELVLLDPKTQRMFTLNATGRVVWNALGTHDLGQIAAQLEAQFEVSREQAHQDVSALLEQLRASGLVHD
jgi:hypothetical protein